MSKAFKTKTYKVSEQEKMDMQTIGDLLDENKKLQTEIELLKSKTYGWCNTCGALVVGDIEHLCDKCGGLDGKTIFDVGFELIKMKQALKGGGQAGRTEPSKTPETDL